MIPEKVEANERIRAEQTTLGLDDTERLPFLCECDDVLCRALVRLTADEYGEVRAASGRYVVVEGHTYDGRVIKTGEGYLVAES
jgi:hypothetical protein